MTNTERIEFGFCAPIFANPGMNYFRTPNYVQITWRDIKESVLLAEALGYDSVFVADHLLLGNEGAIWECWTTLSVIAGFTEKIKLAPIHLCDSFRNPALTAKMISTLDHASNGRLINFYDYGWRRKEFTQYGYRFESDADRIRKMDEGIRIIKGLLQEHIFSFAGDYYQVADAICTPKPMRKIPIWMGEVNHPDMVRSIVRHADVFNSMPVSVEGFREKLQVIKAECDRQDRKYDSIGKSLETQVLLVEDEDQIEAKLRNYRNWIKHNRSEDDDIQKQVAKTDTTDLTGDDRAAFVEKFLIGTADQILEKINHYIDCGVSHFMLWFMDFPSTQSMRQFSEQVMPRVQIQRPGDRDQ
jgi:alkanesulfonate monooxygenase SsuD/methylene tetrahydromethanopterin reductase-like flavin-dependent oxidoreductase (luciferase family)